MGRLMILLCESPFQNDVLDEALEISKSALEKGHMVDMYLMMDGVYGPLNSQSGEPFHMDSASDKFKALIERCFQLVLTSEVSLISVRCLRRQMWC